MTARRVDQNQAAIVAELRRRGCLVVDLHAIGKGVPDLLVGQMGAWYLVEVKTEQGSFTPDEIGFLGKCEQAGLPYIAATSAEQILWAIEDIQEGLTIRLMI